jgi:DNA-binding SARP family transcriptional activator
MPRVDLRLFGGFLLRAAARSRPLPARKAQGLLAYLALRAGRPHPREHLMALLWGDTRDKQARQSLRQTLVRLRRALAFGRQGTVVVQGDSVSLDPATVDVDVVQFERLVRRGTPEALERALVLYRGPLLDGLRVDETAFQEWLDAERARLHELALDALRRSMDRHARAGRVEPAIQAAVRLIALDPLQEDAHRALMRLYVRQGRRPAALRQYQACVAVQQKELGVEPEPETKALYREILQRPAPAGRKAAAGAPAAGPPRPVLTPADAPLVGREPELTSLHRCLQAAFTGRGGVVLVRGEAGIGKSRLVEQLAADATGRGVRTLLGRSYESEQILPFRPWMDALRAGRALAQLPEGGPVRSGLARLFPELTGEGAPPSITGESHLRLFESVDRLIQDLARDAPVVVIIEDLHWADEMTLRLFAFVGRRLADRPVLLVGTVREGDETPNLQRVTAEVAALPHAVTVALTALSADATAALVRALARAGRGDAGLTALTARAWALSGGNPFVIVETVRALRDGRLPGSDEGAIPQRVREMIAARLDRLSPRAQELARLASAFTRWFEFAVVHRAAGLGRRETAEAVEELVRRRIFDTVGEGLDFTHARLRQAVYTGLLAPRRQAYHAAIAEAVEVVYAGRLDDMYERLAYHFSRADEPTRALGYLVHLADKVARAYALEDAARILREALGATGRLPPSERGRRHLEIVYRLAQVLSLLGRSVEVKELLLRQESLVQSLREPALSGVYHFWLAYTFSNLGDHGSAAAHAQRALEDAARSGDEVTMGKANYALAFQSYIVGRLFEAIAHSRQAVALLERADEPWWLGHALWVLGVNLNQVGDYAPALEALDRAREIGESIGDFRLQAFAAGIIGRTYTLMAEPDTAIAAGQRAVELAADPVAQAHVTGWLGATYWDYEQPARAIPLLEDAVARMQELSSARGYRRWDAWFIAALSESYLTKGEVERAQALASTALEVATASGFLVATGYAERALARVMLAGGRVDDAEAAIRRALDTFAATAAHCEGARSRLVLAEILAARAAAPAALAELATAREAFARMQAPRLVERADRLAEAIDTPTPGR